MEMLFDIVLIVHIITGVVGLLSGLVVLILKKGNRTHIIVGRLYFYSMLLSGVFSLILSYIRLNWFLACTGVFVLYTIITGVRMLKLKSRKVNDLDKLISVIMFLIVFTFIVGGVYLIINENSMGIVPLFMGLFGFLMIRTDYLVFKNRFKYKNAWLIMHIQRMMGAYIGSITAFVVTNIKFVKPEFLIWIIPSFIFIPIIIYWTQKVGELRNHKV